MINIVEGWQSGQLHQTVNLTSSDYVGSNPTPSTTTSPFAEIFKFYARSPRCLQGFCLCPISGHSENLFC